MTEEEIQHILKYKTQWWNELRAIQKAEKGENLFLSRLYEPSKDRVRMSWTAYLTAKYLNFDR